MKILVTGGAGFIGSAVVRHLVLRTSHEIVNLDKLTYAASLESLASVSGDSRYSFEKADICDATALRDIFMRHKPDAVMHLAAESHVDRSIDGPDAFIQTNLVGTFRLLEAARYHWEAQDGEYRNRFRFHHISTDEVFGALQIGDPAFCETTPYDPRSPYSASKAGSDHLVQAWGHTYGLPVLLTNCTNNYGPYHFPEKLIPLTIINALKGLPLPVYGKGDNVRDWLFVEDHAAALVAVAEHGRIGESYGVGGGAERTNLQVVEAICDLLDGMTSKLPTGPRRNLIQFVHDRPGHDFRYAMDCSKIERELGWQRSETFESGLAKTIRWYLDNSSWWAPLQNRYSGNRLGLKLTAAI